jgi:hypothetical protein
MPLSCYCETYEPGPGDWYWIEPVTYMTLRQASPKRVKRPRCKSCGKLIGFDDLVIKFERNKIPGCEVEWAIWGEDGEIPLGHWFHCETCADLYFSLKELGYCSQAGSDQRKLAMEAAQRIKKFRELTGLIKVTP